MENGWAIAKTVIEVFFLIYASQLLPQMPLIIEKLLDDPFTQIGLIYAYLFIRSRTFIKRYGHIAAITASISVVVLIYVIRYLFKGSKESFSYCANDNAGVCDLNKDYRTEMNDRIDRYLLTTRDRIRNMEDYLHTNKADDQKYSDPNFVENV